VSERGAQIAAVSAVTPLGATALQSAMAVRARKLEPQSCDAIDKRGRPVGLCAIDGVPESVHGYERHLRLAVRALAELPFLPNEVPLCVALPESGRPDDDPRYASAFTVDVATESGVEVNASASQVFRAGHAGAALAFAKGLELLECGEDAVLVGAVDSYFHPEVLSWLDEGFRLHSVETEDGFVPGEGAAFCLLLRGSMSARQREDSGWPEPRAHLEAATSGLEDTVLEDHPNIAKTMTALLRAEAEARGPIRWVLSDVSSERHRVNEWSLASMREVLDEGCEHTRPVGELGDLGAASGAVLLALAVELFDAAAAPASRAVVALHSEGAERGLLVVTRGRDDSERAKHEAGADAATAGHHSAAGGGDHRFVAHLEGLTDTLEELFLALKAEPSYRLSRAAPEVKQAAVALAALDRNARAQGIEAFERVAPSQGHLEAALAILFQAGDADRYTGALQDVLSRVVAARSWLLNETPRDDGPKGNGAARRFQASTGMPQSFPLVGDLLHLATVPKPKGAPIGPGLIALRRPRRAKPPRVRPNARQRLLRSCMEEIGVLGNLLLNRDDDVFTPGAQRFEERLLRNLDALASLDERWSTEHGSPVLQQVLAHGADAFTPDPFRAFTRAFVLASSDGEQGLRAALLSLRHSDPSTLPAQAFGFVLAAGDGIRAAMDRLAESDDPVMVAFALDVMLRRGERDISVALPLLDHVDDLVRIRALRAMAHHSDRAAGRAALWRALLREVEDGPRVACIESQLLLGDRDAIVRARSLLENHRSMVEPLSPKARLGTLRLLGLAGDTRDSEGLAADFDGSATGARVLGFHGNVAAVTPLLEALEGLDDDGSDGRRRHIRELRDGLRRVLGAGPESVTEGEQPPPDNLELALDRLLDGREEDDDWVPVQVSAWRSWWHDHAQDFDPRVRYRYGLPYRGSHTVRELRHPGVTHGIRRWLALELGFLVAEPPLPIDDWQVRQHGRLDDLMKRLPRRA
jgi:3-oxoacyl-[acyl-carrier-protein] synthase-1